MEGLKVACNVFTALLQLSIPYAINRVFDGKLLNKVTEQYVYELSCCLAISRFFLLKVACFKRNPLLWLHLSPFIPNSFIAPFRISLPI